MTEKIQPPELEGAKGENFKYKSGCLVLDLP